MGFPNIKATISDAKILPRKDLHAAPKHDFFERLHNSKEESVKSVFSSVSVLKIKLPSAEVVVTVDEHGEEEEEDGGCRTPKAVDHKKDVPQKCPPPPRKPKSVPSTKRKLGQRVLLDLSYEIESLFPQNLLRDFVSGKIKKARKETP